jgi:integrase/recombinase XerD
MRGMRTLLRRSHASYRGRSMSAACAMCASRNTDLSACSISTYRSLFGNFMTWLPIEGKAFSELNEADIARFVSSKREAGIHNSRTTRSYLNLLARCFDYLQIRPNPALTRQHIVHARAHLANDQGLDVLTTAQVKLFVAALPPMEPLARVRSNSKWHGWKRRRDHAMQATMLYAGLRVSEAINLRMDQIDDLFAEQQIGPLVLQLPPPLSSGKALTHESILGSYGAMALRSWLDERIEMGLPGDLVFPANGAGDPLHRATVYRQVTATFKRAGLQGPSGGRTLRSTFGVEELRHEGTDTELRQSLGLASDNSTKPYHRAKDAKKVDR